MTTQASHLRVISRRSPEEQLFNTYRTGARKRGLQFALTRKQFCSYIQLPCFYCGKPPSAVMMMGFKPFKYNGIDRIDNERGYTTDNCVPCCGLHNRMKGILTLDEFRSACKAVVSHLKL